MIGKLSKLASPVLLLLPSHAAAFNMPIGRFWGGDITVPQMIRDLVNVLVSSAGILCMSIFAIGAFFYIISAGDDQQKGRGKGMMIGAVLGIIIIAGAVGIMNSVFFFVYGP